MNKRSPRKLVLTTESLRILNPGRLESVRGGTKLVTDPDPITREPTPITEYTCTCPLRG